MTKNYHQGKDNAPKKQNHAPKPKRRRQSQDFSIDLTGKHVFGAYFNMARTNFVKVINHVLPIAGVRGRYEENKINKMLRALFLVQAGREAELTPEQQQWKKKLALTPEQQTRLQRLLFKHFPVLGPIMADVADHKAYLNKKKSKVQTDDEAFAQLRGVALADCLEMVALFGETLTDCRNYYTHKDPYNAPSELADQYRRQELIAKKLDKVVVASRRILKDREGLSVNEVEFLTGIDHVRMTIKSDGKKSFEEYDDFYFKISGQRTVKGLTMTAPNGQPLTIDTQLPALSDFGLLYFCVLFLSKPYAKLFMEEARLFEFSPFTEAENLVMREMLGIYRVRTPQPHRIDSRDDKATLAMDIFGEMRRCPRELYDLLDKQTGQPFFHDVVKRPNDHTPEVSKRLRLTDRFPHLALRYVDEEQLFTRIRFQLQLGAFRYRFYDKKDCVDGRQRVRRIQKDINGYGRLQEVDGKRLERWGDLIQKREERAVKLEHEELYVDLDQFVRDAADSTPYITDRRPSYNIHANRIGLFWEDSQDPKQFKYFDSSKTYLPQLTVSDDQKAPILMPAPRCALSVYDLPAMLFYEHLRRQNKSDKPSAEQLIIDCEADYRRFFKAVADGQLTPFPNAEGLQAHLATAYPRLSMADIPEKLRLYLSSQGLTHDGQPETVRQRMVRLAKEHLEERMRRVEQRLLHYQDDRKKIGDKTNKYGKKSFADVRHGALARYLAQSMMEWQPTRDGKGHDKLTGLNYNVLTAYLATYGSPQAAAQDEPDFTPLTLEQVLAKAHLTGGTNPHPFLAKVLQHEVTVDAKQNLKQTKTPSNIEELYLFYLEEELKHIRRRLQSLGSNDNPSDKTLRALPFVHHERTRFRERTEEEMRTLATRYTTIQLPNGMFAAPIVELLKTHYADNAALQQALSSDAPAAQDPTRNAAYLVTLFYHTVLADDAQPYYQSGKSYIRQSAEGKSDVFSFKRAYELFSILNNKKKPTFPYELIPLFLTCDEIQARVSAKLPDGERQIQHDIDAYVDSLSDRDLKVAFNQSRQDREAERQEKREALRARLRRQVSEVKASERTLRRYKTQDMVLFLLAKQMLTSILNEQKRDINWKQMRLSKVCNDAFLRQTLTFRVPVTLGDTTIYVEQANMSLKNYGEFYRFLSDDRLSSLLQNIADSLQPNADGERVISHTDLMSELASYDQKRSLVFELIQRIEALIIEANKALLDPSDDGFWARKGLPKRNNFASLLELTDQLDNTPLTADERKLLVAIRNAFSHNSYNVDFSLIHDIKHLPQVALGILRHLQALLGVTADE